MCRILHIICILLIIIKRKQLSHKADAIPKHSEKNILKIHRIGDNKSLSLILVWDEHLSSGVCEEFIKGL